MAERDVRAVSSTGTFAAIKPAAAKASPETQDRNAAGSELPVPAKPDLEKLTAKLNLASETIGRDLRFQVDVESGQSVIQVLDRETGEIIRQIPPEKAEVRLTRAGFVELRLYDDNA